MLFIRFRGNATFYNKKLISQNFIDGYSYDYIEVEKGKQKDRMLIDSIVESVVSCTKL